jgi:hypothetical protein
MPWISINNPGRAKPLTVMSGKTFLEYLLADLRKSVAQAHVVDENRHGDQILQAAAADRLLSSSAKISRT